MTPPTKSKVEQQTPKTTTAQEGGEYVKTTQPEPGVAMEARESRLNTSDCKNFIQILKNNEINYVITYNEGWIFQNDLRDLNYLPFSNSRMS